MLITPECDLDSTSLVQISHIAVLCRGLQEDEAVTWQDTLDTSSC
jgi:hypothetical protein